MEDHLWLALLSLNVSLTSEYRMNACVLQVPSKESNIAIFAVAPLDCPNG